MRAGEVLWATVDMTLESDLSKPSEALLEAAKWLRDLADSTEDLGNVADDGHATIRGLTVSGLVFGDVLPELARQARKNSSMLAALISIAGGYAGAAVDTVISGLLDHYDEAKDAIEEVVEAVKEEATGLDPEDLPDPREHITPGMWYLFGDDEEERAAPLNKLEKRTKESDLPQQAMGLNRLARRLFEMGDEERLGALEFLAEAELVVAKTSGDAEMVERKLKRVAYLAKFLGERGLRGVARKYEDAIMRTKGWKKIVARARGDTGA